MAQALLEVLIQHPVQGTLGDAQVRGAHALEEARGPLFAHDLFDAVPTVAVDAPADIAFAGGIVLVELQAGLDQPDGVRGRAGGDAGRRRRRQVHPRVRGVGARPRRVGPLARAVDVEVDAARRDDAHQVRPQALEQRPPPLYPVHVPQDLERLGQVVAHRPQRRHAHVAAAGRGGRRFTCSPQLGLVEIGL